MIQSWRARVRVLKREAYTLVIAARDPRTPWAARLVAGLVVAYIFSPIDLIPDFIPVLGLVDDLLLVPLGLMLAVRLIPAEVMDESRSHVEELLASGRPTSRVAAATIIVIWLALAAVGLVFLARLAR
jgi:uncharacterized membrane protein YkvA (DUF1232 family)